MGRLSLVLALCYISHEVASMRWFGLGFLSLLALSYVIERDGPPRELDL